MQSNDEIPTQDVVRGKACRVESDFMPAAMHDVPHPQLAVTKGELGYAFSDKYADWRLCQFEGSDGSREGWVPTAKLAMGASRADPLPIIVPAALKLPLHPNPASAPRDTLEATICELWSAIRSNREQIRDLLGTRTRSSDEILFGKQSELWPQIIYESFQPGAIEIMKTGSFNPAEFTTLRPVQHLRSDNNDWPQQPGIYVICYEDFDGEVNMSFGDIDVESAVYMGQTVVFQKRDWQHITQMQSSNSSHYKIARHARKRTMVPLLLFDTARLSRIGVKLADALGVAELTLVCLFQSWNKVLFTESSTHAFGSFAIDFTAARLFSPLASQVFKETGWAPIPVLGLNWQTPVISDSPSHRTWVGWFDTAKQMISYRSRLHLTVSKDENNKRSHAFLNLGGDSTGQRYCLDMSLEVADEAMLETGDVIHIIIEIKFDGEYRDHPFMYVPFPRIGKNTEFELLRSMAIRLEWEKEGSWMATYLERMHVWQLEVMAKNGGVLPSIKMGMQIWQLVTTTSYQNPPNWLQDMRGRTSVKFLEYDHLAQEARLVNQEETKKNWPEDNDMLSTTDRLRDMFPSSQYPNTLIGPRPSVPDYFRAVVSNSSRTKCDLCFSQSSTRPCKYNMETNVCEACEILGRPCTWTRGTGLNEQITDGELAELGLSTRLSTLKASSKIREMPHAPFNVDLETDKKEEAIIDSDQE